MESREQLLPPPSNSNTGVQEFRSLGGFTPEGLCSTVNTVCKKTLVAKNFGEFGESQAICQSFYHQFSKLIS